MNSLLSRIDIVCSLDDLFTRVVHDYQLGSFQSYTILSSGYQELNVLLVTSDGRFVVKIFSKEKSLQRVQDNVWGYLAFRKDGVPMPKLQTTAQGKYVFATKGKRRDTYLIVMDYCEGTYLSPIQASDDDIRSLARYMGIIHTHTKRIHRYYDTMGIVNIVSQYNKFKSYLPSDLLSLIEPVVKEFSSLRLNEFRHSVIHGTFEPENILKNAGGDLCLLDLGCMDYNASVIDIATFLANYTIDLPPDQKQKRVMAVLTDYQTSYRLTKQELHALPILIRAQYAIILTRTNYYIQKENDQSKQTKKWFDFGRRGL